MKLTLKKGPLYVQVQDILKERIINEIYPKDTLIPSEPELKEEFGVSMITIRKAVEQLAQQGYVEKRSGVGTTVLDNNAISKLSKGQRFSEYLIEEGHDLQKQYVSHSIVTEAELPVLKQLGGQCHCVERLYTLNDRPYIHFRHYISDKIELPEDEAELQNSLYAIMYRQGFTFSHFKDEFGVAVPEQQIADVLQVEQEPLLQRIRYTYDENDKMIEFSVAFYNTEMHKYVVNFTM